ncbi:unnamed protein product [Rotaria sordida]|uniref:Uncharacterized protein n=1 Tax=Rotaria sordida TaxID=392033 RepID=A0A814M7Q8_9BILA|nr:unnamed protein product [Rotaria sordida]
MGRNGQLHLSYLPGVKESSDKGQSRPFILIPRHVLQWLRDGFVVKVIVACVVETFSDGEYFLWLDKTHEFRGKGCAKQTIGVNPIELDMDLKSIKDLKYKGGVRQPETIGLSNFIRIEQLTRRP